jgi:hypothetical protein
VPVWVSQVGRRVVSVARVRLSPVGHAAVEVSPKVWLEIRPNGATGTAGLLGPRLGRDEIRYLDAAEVAAWPEYGAPTRP